LKPALEQFRNEVTNFYLISLINIIFSALALAFGIAYMVGAVTGISAEPQIPFFRILAGAAAMICFGLGLGWLLSTVKIFEGTGTIRDILCGSGEPVSEERVTCLIVRMLAHYRDNRQTIRTMVLVSTAGGYVFLLLSVATGIRALTLAGNGGSVTFDALALLPPILLTLGIAIVSLLSSYYFSGFSRTWDLRLHEIDESECALKKELGLDEP
jgi:hypothetical protein